MEKPNENIEVAKITSRQTIIVAALTAIVGLATGYFGRQMQPSPDAIKASVAIQKCEDRIRGLESELKASNTETSQARFDLAKIKQRVRDVLGPKEDAIRQMSQSLQRMKGDIGVSQDHSDRLSEIVQQLDKIDNKVLGIVD